MVTLMLVALPVATASAKESSASAIDSSSTKPSLAAIEPPVILEKEPVVFPRVATLATVPVHVLLKVTVGLDGRASDIEVEQSAGEPFDVEAIRVVTLYVFAPAKRRGEPVKSRVLVDVAFVPPVADGVTKETSSIVPAPEAASKTKPSEHISARERPSAPEAEVVVRGEASTPVALEKSADAVTVVRLDQARQRTADMAEVLARTPGILLRRSGGLGSDSRVSINGMYGPAVRVFVDGVPLEFTGYPQNIGTISLNLINHVEIYRGVLPLRLAADALGGAINFALPSRFDDRVAFSYSTGSFGTYRGTVLLEKRLGNHFVTRITGFGDLTRNDYVADVKVADSRGRIVDARVPLLHNGYQGMGGSLEVGVIDKPWAKRLLLRGFYSENSRSIGSNLLMTVPYGEVREGQVNVGGQLMYEVLPSRHSRIEQVVAVARRASRFQDESEWVYDWYGKPVRPQAVPGEVDARPYDVSLWEHSIFARTLGEWALGRGHLLQANVTPSMTTRQGDERRQLDPEARDPLTTRNKMISMVAALGHEWSVGRPSSGVSRDSQDEVEGWFKNNFSIKAYAYGLTAREPMAGGGLLDRDRKLGGFGIADALHYRLSRALSVKSSYEYATRLPASWEVFGNGALVQANLGLLPEVSHNFNLGPILSARDTAAGSFSFFLNGGVRDTRRMVVLLGDDRFYSYQNVYRAVTWFVEGGGHWASPKQYVNLEAGLTANDSRNRSKDGAFAAFNGDPIPNRSPLAISWGVGFTVPDCLMKGDRLKPFYSGRYTEGFYRGWESLGLTQYKQRIAEQTSHDVGVTYTWVTPHYRMSSTLETQNLADARLYDFYGQQRPGRAFYFKLGGEVF